MEGPRPLRSTAATGAVARRGIYLLAILALSGCDLSSDIAAAKSASEEFHRQLDAAEYTSVYEGAAEPFRSSATEEQIAGFFTRVARKLGKCGDASVNFGGFAKTTKGTFVTMLASRTCANGALGEQCIWEIAGEKGILVKYAAQNPLLLTD